MPLVSVIIPTYNRGQFILESIESVLNQSFQDFEILVVDDGSSDDTIEKLTLLIEQNRITYFCTSHRGVSAARNLGIQRAEGILIAFLDSDDLFRKDKLEKQVQYFKENPRAKLVHSNFDKFDINGNFHGTRYTNFFKGYIYPQILEYWEMLMAVSCVMVKTELFLELGLFDENLRAAEDLDMWARITRKYPFHHIPESLAKIRLHSQSTSWEKICRAERTLPYLRKAIEADPYLSKMQVRKTYSKFYAFAGFNMLIEGSQNEIREARKLIISSLKYWPWQIKPWGGLIVSLLNKKSRNFLGNHWRRLRDKKLSYTNKDQLESNWD